MTQKKPINIIPREEGEPEEKLCNRCQKVLPIESFGIFFRMLKNGEERRYRNPRCAECIREEMREKYERFREKKRLGIEEEKKRNNITCRENCAFYPCFKGIDTMSCNLAETCRQFKNKSI